MAEENIISDDPMILAGEYALRVLEGEDLVDAQRRVLADPEFADAVEWWQSWLAAMAEDAAPITPSPRMWSAIETRLEGRDDAGGAPVALRQARPSSAPSGWSMALAGTGVAAMVAAAFIAMPGTTDTPVPTDPATPSAVQPADQLIAQIASEDGAITLAGRIDPATGRLALSTGGFDPGADLSPELWVIPEGGAPVSLGLIPADGPYSRDLTAAERSLLVAGATLAVTMEDRRSAPHAAPTSDVVVAGALDRV